MLITSGSLRVKGHFLCTCHCINLYNRLNSNVYMSLLNTFFCYDCELYTLKNILQVVNFSILVYFCVSVNSERFSSVLTM